MGEGYQSELPNGINRSHSKWPSIPTFLLWMIKDKLDIFDDTCMSAVCREWWLVSASYTRETLGTGAPWLMLPIRKKERQKAKTRNKATRNPRDFMCVAKQKKYSLNLPEFQDYLILYSKQGWLLMKQTVLKPRKQTVLKPRKRFRLILMNPIKKVKIKLPSIAWHRNMGKSKTLASFSMHDAYPHWVVFWVDECEDSITIKTTYVGDKVWTNHTCEDTSWECYDDVLQVIAIREHVYCYNRDRKMLVFNVNTQVWKETPASPRKQATDYLHGFVTEFEGRVVEINMGLYSGEFIFLRYCEATTSWVHLSGDDIKDTSWFIGERSQYSGMFCFCTRGEGVKVHRVCPGFRLASPPFCNTAESPRSFRVVCYDLVQGSREIISLPSLLSIESIWVDL